jgi:hypothetical protein
MSLLLFVFMQMFIFTVCTNPLTVFDSVGKKIESFAAKGINSIFMMYKKLLVVE